MGYRLVGQAVEIESYLQFEMYVRSQIVYCFACSLKRLSIRGI
jgi:hypothetical protein